MKRKQQQRNREDWDRAIDTAIEVLSEAHRRPLNEHYATGDTAPFEIVLRHICALERRVERLERQPLRRKA